MSFRILGLSPAPFRHLFGLTDAELAVHGAQRVIVDETPGYPERIEMREAEPGDTLLLVNHLHQPANTPYRASHAIYIREGAASAFEGVDVVPAILRRRILSLRAFDADHMMVDADLAEGDAIEGRITALLSNPTVAYLHAHFAKRGCYAAHIERVAAQ